MTKAESSVAYAIPAYSAHYRALSAYEKTLKPRWVSNTLASRGATTYP